MWCVMLMLLTERLEPLLRDTSLVASIGMEETIAAATNDDDEKKRWSNLQQENEDDERWEICAVGFDQKIA